MAHEPQDHSQSSRSASQIRLLASGEGLVVRIEEEGHRIERKLSQSEAWELFSNLAGCMRQVTRVQDHGIDDPIDHKHALVLPAEASSVGTNANGHAVIAVSSTVFPTVHVPLNSDQAKIVGTALLEIARLQAAGGKPN